MSLLYEDSDIIAVNKPPGITVIPARDQPPEQSLRYRWQASRKESLWVVHRLDRDTSGVCVFARNAAAHKRWNTAFELRAVTKTYVAFTQGVPPRSGVIDVPLHSARKGRMRPAKVGEPGALRAITHYTLMASRDGVAQVEVQPTTGRQHQIRVHLRSIGTPLLVDPLYGAKSHALCQRLTLHAQVLVLDSLVIEAPLPDDLRVISEFLAGKGKD